MILSAYEEFTIFYRNFLFANCIRGIRRVVLYEVRLKSHEELEIARAVVVYRSDYFGVFGITTSLYMGFNESRKKPNRVERFVVPTISISNPLIFLWTKLLFGLMIEMMFSLHNPILVSILFQPAGQEDALSIHQLLI